jgi:hypothetical protein
MIAALDDKMLSLNEAIQECLRKQEKKGTLEMAKRREMIMRV